jgi:putative ABC transport system permease protein
VYVPVGQQYIEPQVVQVRTAGDPAAAVGAIRRELAALDPEIAMARVATMHDVVSDAVARPRFSATLLSGFATFALILSAIGIYGLLAYDVTQRSREFGVRMAIGASAGDVLRLVMRRAMVLAALGAVLGLAGALATTRLLESLLYDVEATDPTTFVLVTVVLAAVAIVASLIPALRATRVEPVVVLRE